MFTNLANELGHKLVVLTVIVYLEYNLNRTIDLVNCGSSPVTWCHLMGSFIESVYVCNLPSKLEAGGIHIIPTYSRYYIVYLILDYMYILYYIIIYYIIV